MKKIFKLFIILIFPILLCSCNNNENLEGKLVEISAIELTNNFYEKDCKDMIFATVNEHKKGYQQFLKDLEKLAKETNRTIYFTYYQHIDTESALLIFNTYDAYFSDNAYHVMEDDKLIITELYTNYDTMKTKLSNKRYYEKLDMQSEKEIQNNLEEAKKAYDKGNIAISFDYINRIWDEPDAKSFYDSHKYLGLIKAWEHFTVTEDKKTRISYRSLLFYHNSNYYFETLVKEYYEGFTKPNDLSVYDKVYYYVKDDIIYTSDKENGTYKERYKIISIEKTQLKVFDYKYKKDYIFTRRV